MLIRMLLITVLTIFLEREVDLFRNLVAVVGWVA